LSFCLSFLLLFVLVRLFCRRLESVHDPSLLCVMLGSFLPLAIVLSNPIAFDLFIGKCHRDILYQSLSLHNND